MPTYRQLDPSLGTNLREILLEFLTVLCVKWWSFFPGSGWGLGVGWGWEVGAGVKQTKSVRQWDTSVIYTIVYWKHLSAQYIDFVIDHKPRLLNYRLWYTCSITHTATIAIDYLLNQTWLNWVILTWSDIYKYWNWTGNCIIKTKLQHVLWICTRCFFFTLGSIISS